MDVWVTGSLARDMTLRAAASGIDSERVAIAGEAQALASKFRPLWEIEVRATYVEKGVVASDAQIHEGVSIFEDEWLSQFGVVGVVASGNPYHLPSGPGGGRFTSGKGGPAYKSLKGRLAAAKAGLSKAADMVQEKAGAAADKVGQAKDAVDAKIDSKVDEYKYEHAGEHAAKTEAAGLKADIENELAKRVEEEKGAIKGELDKYLNPDDFKALAENGKTFNQYWALKTRMNAVSNGRVATADEIDAGVAKQWDKGINPLVSAEHLDMIQEGSQGAVDFVANHGAIISIGVQAASGFLPGHAATIVNTATRAAIHAAQGAQVVSGVVDQIQAGDKVGAVGTVGSVVEQVIVNKASG